MGNWPSRQRAALVVAVLGFAGLMWLLDARRDKLEALAPVDVTIRCEVAPVPQARVLDLDVMRDGATVRTAQVTLEAGAQTVAPVVALPAGRYTVRGWLGSAARTWEAHADFAVPGAPVVLKLPGGP
jgi:hypothetical protein